MTDEDIEIQADWSGVAGTFAPALREAGFLDGDPGASRLHDWAEEQPWVVGAPERSAKSQHANNVKNKRPCPPGCQFCEKAPSRSLVGAYEDPTAAIEGSPSPFPSFPFPSSPLPSKPKPEEEPPDPPPGGDSPDDNPRPPPIVTKVKPTVEVPVEEIASLAQSYGIPLAGKAGDVINRELREAIEKAATLEPALRKAEGWRELFEIRNANQFCAEQAQFPLFWICGPKNRRDLRGGKYPANKRSTGPPAAPQLNPKTQRTLMAAEAVLARMRGGGGDDGT